MRGEDKETAVHGDRGGATPHYKHVIRTILVCATLVHIQARPLVGVLHVLVGGLQHSGTNHQHVYNTLSVKVPQATASIFMTQMVL